MWNDLKMSLKNAIIAQAVSNGITDLDDIIKEYNELNLFYEGGDTDAKPVRKGPKSRSSGFQKPKAEKPPRKKPGVWNEETFNYYYDRAVLKPENRRYDHPAWRRFFRDIAFQESGFLPDAIGETIPQGYKHAGSKGGGYFGIMEFSRGPVDKNGTPRFNWKYSRDEDDIYNLFDNAFWLMTLNIRTMELRVRKDPDLAEKVAKTGYSLQALAAGAWAAGADGIMNAIKTGEDIKDSVYGSKVTAFGLADKFNRRNYSDSGDKDLSYYEDIYGGERPNTIVPIEEFQEEESPFIDNNDLQGTVPSYDPAKERNMAVLSQILQLLEEEDFLENSYQLYLSNRQAVKQQEATLLLELNTANLIGSLFEDLQNSSPNILIADNNKEDLSYKDILKRYEDFTKPVSDNTTNITLNMFAKGGPVKRFNKVSKNISQYIKGIIPLLSLLKNEIPPFLTEYPDGSLVSLYYSDDKIAPDRLLMSFKNKTPGAKSFRKNWIPTVFDGSGIQYRYITSKPLGPTSAGYSFYDSLDSDIDDLIPIEDGLYRDWEGKEYYEDEEGNIFEEGYGPKYFLDDPYDYAKGGKIHIKPSKRGTFTAAAKKHGKSVLQFASQVLANKDNYSPAMVKKANFARNAAKWHGYGGNLFLTGGPEDDLPKTKDLNPVEETWEEYYARKNDEIVRERKALESLYAIPIIPSKIIALTGDTPYKDRGAIFSENLLDSIYKNASAVGLPFAEGLGLVAQESTLANAKNRGMGVGYGHENNNGTWTPRRIGMQYSPVVVTSDWSYINDNPYNDALAYARKKANIELRLKDGLTYTENLVKKFKLRTPPLLHAFELFKEGKYNPGEPDHKLKVIKRGEDIIKYSPEVQRWMKRNNIK